MKRVFLTAGVILAAAGSQAVTIANWGFEVVTPPDQTNQTTYGPFAPDSGVGFATGTHADGATDWSTPAGNGSANSFSSNTWSVGDFYQFQVSTVGFFDVVVDFDATSSNTGPRDFNLQYSTDGSTFTTAASYSVLPNGNPNPAWNSTTFNPVYHFTVDLSSVSALDNQATVYIRLTNSSTVAANGGTVATTGTSRVDNIVISASPVPEPATLAVLGLGAAALIRRRRSA